MLLKEHYYTLKERVLIYSFISEITGIFVDVSERSTNGGHSGQQLQVDNDLSRTTTDSLGRRSPPAHGQRPEGEARGRHRSDGSETQQQRERSRSPLDRAPSPPLNKSSSSAPSAPHSPSRVEQAEPAARFAAEHAIKVSDQSQMLKDRRSLTPPAKASDMYRASNTTTSTSSPPPQRQQAHPRGPSPSLSKANSASLNSGSPFEQQQQSPGALAGALAAMQGQNPMQVKSSVK